MCSPLVLLCVSILLDVGLCGYIGFSALKTRDEAEAHCKSLGYNLASIHSKSDLEAAKSVCQQNGGAVNRYTTYYGGVSIGGCWIGLDNTAQPGSGYDFVNLDGSPTDYGFTNNCGANPTFQEPWGSPHGGPSPNSMGHERCVYLSAKYNVMMNMDDVNCNIKFPFACNDSPSSSSSSSSPSQEYGELVWSDGVNGPVDVAQYTLSCHGCDNGYVYSGGSSETCPTSDSCTEINLRGNLGRSFDLTGYYDAEVSVSWKMNIEDKQMNYLLISVDCDGDSTDFNNARSVALIRGSAWEDYDEANFEYECGTNYHQTTGKLGTECNNNPNVKIKYDFKAKSPNKIFYINNLEIRAETSGKELIWSDGNYGVATTNAQYYDIRCHGCDNGYVFDANSNDKCPLSDYYTKTSCTQINQRGDLGKTFDLTGYQDIELSVLWTMDVEDDEMNYLILSADCNSDGDFDDLVAFKDIRGKSWDGYDSNDFSDVTGKELTTDYHKASGILPTECNNNQNVGLQIGIKGKDPNKNFFIQNIELKGRASAQSQELLIMRHENVENGWFDATRLDTTGLENENNPTANTYSIVGNLKPSELVSSDGYYYFKMIYGYPNDPDDVLIWRQQSWPTDSDSVSGYQSISLPANNYGDSTCGGFNGLMLNHAYKAYGWLDSNVGGCFWNSIGAFKANPWSYGMPAFNVKGAKSAALYICPKGDQCWSSGSAADALQINNDPFEVINPIKPIESIKLMEPNNEYIFEISESTLLVIGGLLILVLIINIIFLYRSACSKQVGYHRVKYVDTDTEFVDSEANIVS